VLTNPLLNIYFQLPGRREFWLLPSFIILPRILTINGKFPPALYTGRARSNLGHDTNHHARFFKVFQTFFRRLSVKILHHDFFHSYSISKFCLSSSNLFLPNLFKCRRLFFHVMTHSHTTTVGKIPLDEGSARRRDL
jgi:hypothetical protein